MSSVQGVAEPPKICNHVHPAPRTTRRCFTGKARFGHFQQSATITRPNERSYAGTGGGDRHYFYALSGSADDFQSAGRARRDGFYPPQRIDLEPDADFLRKPRFTLYRIPLRVCDPQGPRLGPLGLSAYPDYRDRLSVGGLARLGIPGAVQYRGRLAARNFPFAGDAKAAGSAGAGAAVYSCPQPTFFPATVILRRDRIAGPRFS